MLKELDRIVLLTDVTADGLQAGDVGTIVHVHADGKAFMVEFISLAGDTVAVSSLSAEQVRPVGERDMTHVRTLSVA
jgi:hypothetical protein